MRNSFNAFIPFFCILMLLMSPMTQCNAADDAAEPIQTIPVNIHRDRSANGNWLAFVANDTQLAYRFSYSRITEKRINTGHSDARLELYHIRKKKVLESVYLPDEGTSFRESHFAVIEHGRLIVGTIGHQACTIDVPIDDSHKPKVNLLDRKSFLGSIVKASTQFWLNEHGSGYTVDRTRESLSCYRWNLQKPDDVRWLFQQRYGVVQDTIVHPESQTLVASIESRVGGPKPALVIWNLVGKPIERRVPLKLLPYTIAISPDGKMIAIGNPDGSAAWFPKKDPTTITTIPSFCNFTVACSAFHPTGKYLAFGSFDGGQPNLFLIDVESGKVLHKIAADASAVEALCFNKAGTRLATFGSSGVIKIWDANALIGSMQ